MSLLPLTRPARLSPMTKRLTEENTRHRWSLEVQQIGVDYHEKAVELGKAMIAARLEFQHQMDRANKKLKKALRRLGIA